MFRGNRLVSAVAITAAAFMLSGCSGSVTVSAGEPEWKASISQSSEVSAETRERLEKTEPQFKTDRYSATIVTLGERVETAENKKIVTVAIDANLPQNCLDHNSEELVPNDGSGACLAFMYGAATERVEQDGKSYKYPLNSFVDTTFLETTNGASIVEITSPLDTHRYTVYMIADGESLMIDPVSGELLSGTGNDS